MAGPSATSERLVLTVVFAGGVVLTLAVFNVAGWAVTWKSSLALALLFCGVALFAEFLGFNLAIAAERQWAKKRKDRFAVCVYSLAVCAVVNVVSGHNAWTTFERMMLEPARQAEQRSLDRERGAYLDEIAALDRQLDAARPPPEAAVGPQARAEARRVYEIEIARQNPRRERLQGHLDALPVVAPERRIIAEWAVWLAFAAIELMKALVLWGVGAGDIGQRLRSAAAGVALGAQTPSEPAQAPERPAIIEPPLELDLALPAQGRALLDKLVASNVVSMTDVASKHAARPRRRRKREPDAARAA